jgi:hypothetical protein
MCCVHPLVLRSTRPKLFFLCLFIIQERDAPHSLALAKTFKRIGVILREMNDLSSAEYCFKSQLKILVELNPKSSEVTDAFANVTSCLQKSSPDYSNIRQEEDW